MVCGLIRSSERNPIYPFSNQSTSDCIGDRKFTGFWDWAINLVLLCSPGTTIQSIRRIGFIYPLRWSILIYCERYQKHQAVENINLVIYCCWYADCDDQDYPSHWGINWRFPPRWCHWQLVLGVVDSDDV